MIGTNGSVFNIGVQGMLKSHNAIKQNADDIVKSGVAASEAMSGAATSGAINNSVEAQGGDFIGDLTTSMVDMKVNQHVFDASAKIIKTADEMLGTVLDIKS